MRIHFVKINLLLLLFNLNTVLISAQVRENESAERNATEASSDNYNIIFSQDFEHHNAPIEYTTKIWNPDWNNPGWRDGDYRSPEWFAENIKDSIIVDKETGSKVMQFNFTDTIVDGYAGATPYRGGDYWRTSLGSEPKELYLSYNVKFRPGFIANRGGKLPATNGGSPLNPDTQFDCVRPGEGEGYSTALLFKSKGRIQWYMYYQEQVNDQWGDSHYWDDFQPEGLNYTSSGELSLDLSQERWYNITIRVVVNSFSNGSPNKDGIMEGFIDGKLVSSLTGLYLLTSSDVDKGVNQISLGHFFGGNETYQAPQRDEWTLFDDFICFNYNENVDVIRGNTPSPAGRVLQLPNLKTPLENPLDRDPPTVPSDLRTTASTGSFIEIEWTASIDNTSVKGYRIFVNGHEHGQSLTNSYVVDELEPNTQYSITVSAYDDFSNESQRSNALFASTLFVDTISPSIPSGVVVSDSSENSISIKWESSTDNNKVEGYRIYLNDTISGEVESNFFTLTDLLPDTEYTITVTSFDASNNESQKSNPLLASTMERDVLAPTVPTDLVITEVSQNSVSLMWSISNDNNGVAGYHIFLNGQLNGSSSDNSHTITNLDPGITYSISVSAYDNALNESANSRDIFITTPNPNNSSTPALPVVEIVDFSSTSGVNTAATLTEIRSAGHTELLDFGLMISNNADNPDKANSEFIYADVVSAELSHSKRVNDGLQLMYDFSEGKGAVVYNRVESENSMDLKIVNPLATSWISGHGLRIDGSTLISSESVPSGLINSISTSNEVTFETWIRTSEVNQSGPARIVTLSKDNENRIATLGQEGNSSSFSYSARLSTTATGQNGTPGVKSEESFIDLHLHHVVYTKNEKGEEKIYVNGVEKYSGIREGRISSAGEENYLALANELSGERPWIGSYYLVAIYDKALDHKDVTQNYEAGTGVIKFSNDLFLIPEEAYTVTPFARTNLGISFGNPVEFSLDNLNDIQEDSLYMTIYPNPSNGDFNVHVVCNVKNAHSAYLRVSDMMGQIIYNERLPLSELYGESYASNANISDVSSNGTILEYSLSNLLTEGVYLVTLIVGNQAVGERLIVHQ